MSELPLKAPNSSQKTLFKNVPNPYWTHCIYFKFLQFLKRYFARYLDPKNENSPIGHEASKNLPVDLYIGGKEHATLHMYFARFFTHFMNSIGLSPVKEPFQSLLVQGMVKGKSYR